MNTITAHAPVHPRRMSRIGAMLYVDPAAAFGEFARVLLEQNGNITRTAKVLCISRRSAQRWAKRIRGV